MKRKEQVKKFLEKEKEYLKDRQIDFLNCSLEEYKAYLRKSRLKHEREFAERVNEKCLYEIKQAYLKAKFESYGKTCIKVA